MNFSSFPFSACSFPGRIRPCPFLPGQRRSKSLCVCQPGLGTDSPLWDGWAPFGDHSWPTEERFWCGLLPWEAPSVLQGMSHCGGHPGRYKNWLLFSSVVHTYFIIVSLDRTIGSKRHNVSMTLRISPQLDTSSSSSSSNFSPKVFLDLASRRHESQLLPGGHAKKDLMHAIREGVEGACIQGLLKKKLSPSVHR